jgi:dipeptidyl aminopeptidase/acylaminoacyl peptidase
MKKLIVTAVLLIPTCLFLGYLVGKATKNCKLPTPIQTITPKPLEKYKISSLSQKEVPQGRIEISQTLKEDSNFTSYLFTHSFDPTLQEKTHKTISGLLNIPDGSGSFPLVLLIRGYVDQQIYQTGMGSSKVGEFFANNGFITLSPDFLGYASSSPESQNIFETRFQTYTTTLSLLSSLDSIEKWDKKNTFIWAHSNGGQIALTTLAITQRNIPTTLWAPVTKPFPYNILYYTDEAEDGGALIRSELSKFEALYDANDYSFTNFLENISAPLQIHQGTADDAVPLSWTESFVKSFEKQKDKEITLYIYPNTDHNMTPNWDQATMRDLDFFLDTMQK